jgi:hypothetical protein
MEWGEAVQASERGLAVTITEDGVVLVVNASGLVRAEGDAATILIDESRGALADWSPLGERTDPLRAVRTGSAIALVNAVGKRQDQQTSSRVTISTDRLYALEMLVAHAIVYFRNVAVPTTDESRAAVAIAYADAFLGEVWRYVEGREAMKAPTMQALSRKTVEDGHE